MWTPFYSINFHREFLRRVDAELAATGFPHSFGEEGTATVTIGGRGTVLDLRALARTAAPRPLVEWRDLVGEDVRRHVAGAQAAARFLERVPPAGDALPLVVLRLVTDHTPSAVPGPASAARRPLVAGLAVELAYDLPASMVTVPDSHLAAWKHDVDALFSAAADNTRARVRAIVGRSRTAHYHYDVLAQENALTASAMLCLDELVGPVTPYGVLVGVPSRHELVAHVVTGTERAAEVLRDLPAGLRQRHARVPAPLSPALYWWHGGDADSDPAHDATDNTATEDTADTAADATGRWPEFSVVPPGTSPADLTARVRPKQATVR